jgi:hypothetical protein
MIKEKVRDTNRHSPRKSQQPKEIDSPDAMAVPHFEMESPVGPLRRKGPERLQTQTLIPRETWKIGTPVRSVSVLPNTSPRREEVEEDIWTGIVHSPQRVVTTAPLQERCRSPSPAKRAANADVGSSALSVDLGTAVLEIQTVLRRDLEKLRLDIVRQFISFRGEMTHKWEDEVESLRRENAALKEEVASMRKEQQKKTDAAARWKLC